MSEIVEVDETTNSIYVLDTRFRGRGLRGEEHHPYKQIDWLALAKQKWALVRLIWDDEGNPLWGLVRLIDELQDDACDRGYPVVYGYDLESWREDHPYTETPNGPERQA